MGHPGPKGLTRAVFFIPLSKQSQEQTKLFSLGLNVPNLSAATSPVMLHFCQSELPQKSFAPGTVCSITVTLLLLFAYFFACLLH